MCLPPSYNNRNPGEKDFQLFYFRLVPRTCDTGLAEQTYRIEFMLRKKRDDQAYPVLIQQFEFLSLFPG